MCTFWSPVQAARAELIFESLHVPLSDEAFLYPLGHRLQTNQRPFVPGALWTKEGAAKIFTQVRPPFNKLEFVADPESKPMGG